MARLPRNATEAVAELGVKAGGRVLAFGPANGYVEALSEAVGDGGSVVVLTPPPELETPSNAEIVDEIADDATGDAVVVWVGPVPAHSVREYRKHVADGGTLWVVFPRGTRDVPSPVHESDVKKAMLTFGWRDDRSVQLSTDAYAVRFRRRR